MDGRTGQITNDIRYTIDDIPRDVCDVIIYKGNVVPTSQADLSFITTDTLNSFSSLHEKNKQNVQLLGSVQDPSAASTVFSNIMAQDVTRTQFALKLITFVQQFYLDGVEIDWRNPQFASSSDKVSKSIY